MRIAFVTNNYTPYSAGIVSSINSSYQELTRQGHDVRIITLDFLGPKLTHDPAHVIRLPTWGKFTHKHNHLAIPLRATAHMHEVLAAFKPDIIHSHHPFVLGVTALHVARMLEVPIVFTFHTHYEDYIHYVPLPASLCMHYIRSRIHAYGNAVDGIIAPSESTVSYIRSFTINKPIVVIPSGLQDIFVHNTCPEKPSTRDHVMRLLFVGRFTQEKNIPFLLRALALLNKQKPNRFTALLAGFGYAYDELRAFAYNTLQLPKDVVQFINNPSLELIAKLYEDADFFIFSSHTETQGLVLIEAMAAGAACIALDCEPQKSLIKNGSNGFLVHNEHDMADKIALLIDDSSLRASLSYQAWQTAQAYTPQVTTKKLIDFYQHIIDKKINETSSQN